MDGSALVDEIEALAEEFREILDSEAPSLTLSLEGLDRVDVSFFQLLLSLKKSLGRQDRKLFLQALPAEHPVMKTSALLGIELEHYLAITGSLS